MSTYSIKELRRLLLNEQVFANVMDYFFQWFEEHHQMAFKTETSNETLKEAVTHGIMKACNKELIFYKMFEMREVKELCLLHGAGETTFDVMATFFYFTDLDLGMGVMARKNSDQETLMRFQMLGPDKVEFNVSDQMN